MNSTAERESGCEKGRNWTGNRTAGEGKFMLTALTATTPYILTAFPGNQHAFNRFTLVSICLFGWR